jgi:phosphatidylserine decarboxylase
MATFGFGLWCGVAALVLGLGAGFMAFFFRDPDRTCPAAPGIVVSPADGRVMVVERSDAASPSSPTLISIFLSPLDVHINRSPIAGTITDVTYRPGRFEVASKRIASEVNEQNVLTIAGASFTVVTRQIAGILARRVVCWKRAGDTVAIGERIGLMKFSSRMDVVVPAGLRVLCAVGDRVVAGQTVIAQLADGGEVSDGPV